MFIVFEGGEGSGKSTQSKLLVEFLNFANIPVIHTREPGGTKFAERVREVLVTGEADQCDGWSETMLFAAARRNHIQKVIEPALNDGKIVVCDRFIGSTMALQGARGVPKSWIQRLHQQACFDLYPHITILLDGDANLMLSRAKSRLTQSKSNEDRFESLGFDFHKMVREEFLEQARTMNNYLVFDAFLDSKLLHEQIVQKVLEKISSQSK